MSDKLISSFEGTGEVFNGAVMVAHVVFRARIYQRYTAEGVATLRRIELDIVSSTRPLAPDGTVLTLHIAAGEGDKLNFFMESATRAKVTGGIYRTP